MNLSFDCTAQFCNFFVEAVVVLLLRLKGADWLECLLLFRAIVSEQLD
jgi:hypothetical protein